jgi:hypothetical protein
MKYRGGCHCGNLRIEFETAISPAEIELRACQCTFCRKHNSRAVTDPAGHLTIRAAREDDLGRYAFGLRTAEYLICEPIAVDYDAESRDDRVERRRRRWTPMTVAK